MGYCRSVAGAAFCVIALICATAARAETALQRGTYLMHGIVACGNCHTPKGPDFKPLQDLELAGGFAIDAPVFHAVAPNITPDKETGIGGWTDEEIIDAIRNGKRRDDHRPAHADRILPRHVGLGRERDRRLPGPSPGVRTSAMPTSTCWSGTCAA